MSDKFFTSEGFSTSVRELHTPSAFVRDNLLYVQETGKLKANRPHKSGREKLESYLLILVEEGKGCVTVGSREYQVSGGDIILIDCMDKYSHISSEQDLWTLSWVHFNGRSAKAYYEYFLKCNGGNNVYSLSGASSVFGGDTAARISKTSDILAQLLERTRAKSIADELECGKILLELLNGLVISAMENLKSDTQNVNEIDDEAVASSLRKQLNDNYASVTVLRDIETYTGLPYSKLAECFRRYFGISIEEYVADRRFNAAKELLRFTVKSVDEVAEEAGVGDRIALAQLFAAREGMSAEDYRSKWAGWIRA